MNAPRARKAHLDALSISLLLACCMFWGFQQVLVKATVAEVAPVFQAFVRFALATVAVAAWCLWSGLRTPVPSAAGAVPSPTPPGAADKASAPRLGGWGPGLLAGALFAGEFACIYLGLQLKTKTRLLGAFIAPFILLFLIAAAGQGSDRNLVPSQWQGGLTTLHLVLAIAGEALFVLASAAGAMFLIQNNLLKNKKPGQQTITTLLI